MSLLVWGCLGPQPARVTCIVAGGHSFVAHREGDGRKRGGGGTRETRKERCLRSIRCRGVLAASGVETCLPGKSKVRYLAPFSIGGGDCIKFVN